MKVFAIVLAMEPSESPRGLSADFNPEERRLLSAAMLEDVLNAVGASAVREALAVGSDSSLRQVAAWCGASFLSKENVNLDSAVQEALAWCMEKKADAVLILPANIPLLASSDVDAIIALGSVASSVVLAPSLKGGVNAVFLNPPNLLRASFGSDSFFVLVKEALEKNVGLKFYSSRSLAFDFDSKNDLCKLLTMKSNAVSKRVFKEINEQAK